MGPRNHGTVGPAGLLICGFFVVWVCCAPAQTNLTTILSTGPAANRLNIVLLSEGYTSNQLAQFLGDATDVVNAFLPSEPYLEYRSYFNAYAISVPSNQSGSDHPANGTNSYNFRD